MNKSLNIGPCSGSVRDQLIEQGVLSSKHRNSTAFDAAQAILHRLWWSRIAGTISEEDFYLLRDKTVKCVFKIAENLMLDS